MEEHKEGIFLNVDETLYFERGQEIDEMLTISLDPDITLQMYEQYIQIRGIVMLQGEYRKYNQQQETLNIQRRNAVYVEKVLDKNAREAKFTHRFPLDIRIPNDRVNNMNDIEITIDAFDYELPDIQTLVIEARLQVHGVQEKAPEVGEMETKKESSNTVETDEGKEEAVIKAKEKEITPPEEPTISGESDDYKVANPPETTNEDESIVSENPTDEKEPISQDTPNEAESVSHGTDQTKKESNIMELIEDEPEQKTENLEKRSHMIDDTGKEMAIQLSETEELEEEDTVKDVRFLTDLFGGDEEETTTMIKLYIIQEEDTIESIAKKYEVPTLELLKGNQLSGDDLHEGEIIQIPISK